MHLIIIDFAAKSHFRTYIGFSMQLFGSSAAWVAASLRPGMLQFCKIPRLHKSISNQTLIFEMLPASFGIISCREKSQNNKKRLFVVQSIIVFAAKSLPLHTCLL
jgi:hypothetical protein